jgi:Zn-dependent peptidase ImmA (M78 family)
MNAREQLIEDLKKYVETDMSYKSQDSIAKEIGITVFTLKSLLLDIGIFREKTYLKIKAFLDSKK